MWPVISARLMIACAVRVASWLWLTPIVHQKETRSRVRIIVASFCNVASGTPVSRRRVAGVKSDTKAANDSKPVVCAEIKIVFHRPAHDEFARKAVEEGKVGLGAKRDVQRGGLRVSVARGSRTTISGERRFAHHALPT